MGERDTMNRCVKKLTGGVSGTWQVPKRTVLEGRKHVEYCSGPQVKDSLKWIERHGWL
jgi:hypothetical protein